MKLPRIKSLIDWLDIDRLAERERGARRQAEVDALLSGWLESRRQVYQQQRVTAPADCPLGPDCETCPPSEYERQVYRAELWLITQYPDAWYWESASDVRDVARRLVDARDAVLARRITP